MMPLMLYVLANDIDWGVGKVGVVAQGLSRNDVAHDDDDDGDVDGYGYFWNGNDFIYYTEVVVL